MPGALSSRESGSVVVIFAAGVSGTLVGARRVAAEAAPVARDAARPVGLIGLVRGALGRKLLVETAPGLGQPRPARARDRPRLALAALVEVLAGVAQPAAAALVDRPATRHRGRVHRRARLPPCPGSRPAHRGPSPPPHRSQTKPGGLVPLGAPPPCRHRGDACSAMASRRVGRACLLRRDPGRRACRSLRGPCGDAGDNPSRRQEDEGVAPTAADVRCRGRFRVAAAFPWMVVQGSRTTLPTTAPCSA